MSSTEASSNVARAMETPSCAMDYVRLFRPHHWLKNIVVFVGPAAGMKLFTADGFVAALFTFFAFCLGSSATYALNDVLDRHADALHPLKRNRPVASGRIGPGPALVGAVAFAIAGLVIAWGGGGLQVAVILAMYLALTISYSIVLKKLVILDVMVIAIGFVLRAWAGAQAVHVTTSEWLVVCMFTLCLFMGFGKRRCEITMLGNGDATGKHRATLLRYTPDLLNHLITVSAGIAVMTFLIYTLDTTRPAPFPKEHLLLTLPLVVYGLFRYAMLTELGVHSGPTEIILKDKPILIVIGLWGMAAIAVAYQKAWLPYLGFSVA